MICFYLNRMTQYCINFQLHFIMRGELLRVGQKNGQLLRHESRAVTTEPVKMTKKGLKFEGSV